TKAPLEFVIVSITTRSTLLLSFCSKATTVLPPEIVPLVTLSTAVPEMDDEVSDTSPACNTGFSRNCPLPRVTMEAQALKSTFRSLVCPAAMVNWPPAIWPEGILIPVCDSEDSASVCGVLLASPVRVTQLAELPHLLPETVAPLSAS